MFIKCKSFVRHFLSALSQHLLHVHPISQYLFCRSNLFKAPNLCCASSSLNHVLLVHLIKPFCSKHSLCALVSHIVYLKLVFYQVVLYISMSTSMLLIPLSSNHTMAYFPVSLIVPYRIIVIIQLSYLCFLASKPFPSYLSVSQLHSL